MRENSTSSSAAPGRTGVIRSASSRLIYPAGSRKLHVAETSGSRPGTAVRGQTDGSPRATPSVSSRSGQRRQGPARRPRRTGGLDPLLEGGQRLLHQRLDAVAQRRELLLGDLQGSALRRRGPVRRGGGLRRDLQPAPHG